MRQDAAGVFNEKLATFLPSLFRLKRGEIGGTQQERELTAVFVKALLQLEAQQIFDTFIKGVNGSSRNATAKKNLGKISADASAILDRFSAGWLPLKHVTADLAGLPNALERKIIEDGCAYIRGHFALAKIWEEAHAEWLKKKGEWESKEEHKRYLAVRPRFDNFEISVGGKIGKRRARWHKYFQWLRETPDLAGWRGGPAGVSALSKQAQERVRKAKPWRQRGVEAEEFWKANPELQALDKLHGHYEKEYVRRGKKRNLDGFEHRPTFTLPHFLRHPQWLVFNAPQTSPSGYRNLKLPAKAGRHGEIELKLLIGEMQGSKYPADWVRLRFLGDPRLADFTPVRISKTATKGTVKGKLRERPAYQFLDRKLRMERLAQISGAKLIFKNIHFRDGLLQSATPYLYFTCEAKTIRWSENAKNVKWNETGEVTKKGKKRGYRTLPDGLVACAVDLGIRNLGFATLARYDKGIPRVLRSRNLWIGHIEAGGRHPGRWSGGPELAHLARHKKELRKLRSLRGDPVAGEESHVELQRHITDFAEDRFKKAARAIVQFALNIEECANMKTGEIFPRADVLVLENLATLLPNAERSKGINRALIEFNRGHLVERVKEQAKDVGLKVFEVSPKGTSQVCSRCGALGRRYSIRRSPTTHKPEIQFGLVEKLFACAQCNYRANADHNASVNLHRTLAQRDALQSYFVSDRDGICAEIEVKLLPLLRKSHGLDGSSSSS